MNRPASRARISLSTNRFLASSAAALVYAAAAWPVHAGGPPSFTELPRFGAGATICVAWSDSDLDGDLDLAVGNTNNQQNFLFVNDGALGFASQNAFGLRSTFALAWGDVDNDGDPDMAVGNASFQGNRLIRNDGGNTFTGQNQFGIHRTVAMAWADCDLDGDLDLAVGNGILGGAEQNNLYVNNGDGTWTEEAQFGVGQTCSLVWGDVDGDGDPDLAAGNGGFGFVGQNFLYINNGDGTFTERADFGLGDTASLVFGDCDNDGDLDVAVANWNGGQSALYVNDGAGNFAGHAEFGIGDPNTVAWGDFDNDGDLDLAQGNGDFTTAAPNTLWVNDGAGSFTASAQFGLGSTDGVAWGDADRDGDLDLAAGNEHTPTTNYLYVNEENDADGLFLHLVGHHHDLGDGHSNRDAVGAKVSAYEAGFLGDPAHRLGFREIAAHGGFSSQNQIDAHFGLPGHASVDVRIEWPGSGGTHVTQDLLGVPVPGRFEIHESITATGAPVTASSEAGWRVVPNPSAGDVRFERLRGTEAARLSVVDVQGRLVRRLAVPRGTLATVWDGRDGAGRSVGAGVFFVRSTDGRTSRVVRLR